MSEKTTYEVIQIDEASWRIEENGVRAFLFAGTDKAILVDTGFGTGNIKEIIDTLTNLPVMLINTHGDRDHVGGNTLFEKAYMHPAEYDHYYLIAGVERPVCPLWEGDVIDIGGRSFEIILIPGHTPGSIALLDAKNRILVSGDSVQSGLIFMVGPGRNTKAYIESIEKLHGMRDRFDVVYPSHGPFTVSADILRSLIDGVQRLRNGELKASDAPFETTAKVYDAGVANFLY